MKSYLNFFGFALLVVMIGCKEKTQSIPVCENSRFYYYYNEKQYLKEEVKKATISFSDTISIDTIHDIFQSFLKIQYSSTNIKKAKWMSVTINANTCAEVDNIFSKLLTDKRVTACNRDMLAPKDYDMGVTDIIMCKLINDSLTFRLNELNTSTNSSIYRYDSTGKYYLIRVHKNAKMDAIDLANKYYESGYFIFSQPDFILHNVLLVN